MILERVRGEWWSRAIRIIAPLGAFLVEGWPALLGALIVQEGGLWLAGKLTDSCHKRFVSGLYVGAYGLRMAIALPTHYVARFGDGNGSLFPDAYTNDLVAEWLTRIASGDGSTVIFPGHQHLLESFYPFLLMGLYSVFGYAPLLPKLLNIGLAGLSAVLIFDLTRQVFQTRAAVLAALGAAVLPTLVIWSIVSLKETLVLFVGLVGLRAVQYMTTAARDDPHWMNSVIALIAALVLLLDLRTAAALILVLLIGVVLVTRAHFRIRSWQVGLVTLGLAVMVGGIWLARGRSSNRPLTGLVEDVVLQIRHRRAQEAAAARSQLRPEVEVVTVRGSQLPVAEASSDATPFTVVGDVLDPLGYAALAPAPWQARSLSELGVSMEMLVWYALLAASFFAWRASPRQRLFVICLVFYGVANWLVLAASEGNLGNLLRHRLMLDTPLLILGSAGLGRLRVRA